MNGIASAGAATDAWILSVDSGGPIESNVVSAHPGDVDSHTGARGEGIIPCARIIEQRWWPVGTTHGYSLALTIDRRPPGLKHFFEGVGAGREIIEVKQSFVVGNA